MIVAVDQTTWDLWGQIGLWFVGLPLLVGILVMYIAAQITVERRENQELGGRWGISAKSKRDSE